MATFVAAPRQIVGITDYGNVLNDMLHDHIILWYSGQACAATSTTGSSVYLH